MLGQRIKDARLAKGLSQEQLGDLIGVSKVTICWYESNTRTPSLENFEKLVDALEISADYALGKEVTAVSENSEYKVKVAKKDLEILSALKAQRDVYNKLYEDPIRTSELISRKLK